MRQLVNPRLFGRPTIGFALFGCANRPFYQICVFPDKALGRRFEGNIVEQVSRHFLDQSRLQLGSFDPLPNSRNEKLVALNLVRIKYWIGERDAHVSLPVLELLGLAGLLPIHPKTFVRARHNRQGTSVAKSANPPL